MADRVMPVQLAIEVEEVGGTCDTFFSINGQRFAAMPAQTRYVDYAEDLAIELLSEVFFRLLQARNPLLIRLPEHAGE